MKKILLLSLLLASGLPAQAVKRYVTLDGTRLLSKPAAFSKSYGKLKLGQVVWAELASHGYYKVTIQDAATLGLKKDHGYLSAHALQESHPKIGSASRQSGDASAEEVAAATKGFNTQVEAQYSKDHSQLDYNLLNKLEARSTISHSDEVLKDFKEKGKLGEYAPANQDKGGDDE